MRQAEPDLRVYNEESYMGLRVGLADYDRADVKMGIDLIRCIFTGTESSA